ncbi:MAG: DUF998 domain-containing protein [Candidatus Bathyarchaeia archaeon]|jgi:hypothetical membrane protein
MNEKNYALFGLFGPVTAMIFITAAIGLSPWFSWWNNALSDLGHSVTSEVAPLFNFGLLLTGFCIIVYSITSFKNHAKYTSYALAFTGFALQLVATFNEVYRPLHFQVSVLFFLSLCVSSVCYIQEKKSRLAIVALVISLLVWILYGIKIYSSGIAVPEAVSAIATASWVMLSAFRIYVNKTPES